jgi:hypothetical protein
MIAYLVTDTTTSGSTPYVIIYDSTSTATATSTWPARRAEYGDVIVIRSGPSTGRAMGGQLAPELKKLASYRPPWPCFWERPVLKGARERLLCWSPLPKPPAPLRARCASQASRWRCRRP